MAKAGAEGMAETDAYLFGRKTYQKMAAFWPMAPADDPFAAHLNGTTKYVASRTVRDPSWRPVEVLTDDVPGAVAALKEKPGGTITVLGSGELVRALLTHGLVDELELTVSPLVLGSGKRLFGTAPDVRRLELVSTVPTSTGSVMLRYRLARLTVSPGEAHPPGGRWRPRRPRLWTSWPAGALPAASRPGRRRPRR